MNRKIWIVDAFTIQPFRGNPAGVCYLDETVDEAWMRAVAGELNLSETAFLLAEDEGFNLRWFTPLIEVDLCGHATLASAHILWSEGLLALDETARFFTRSGELKARRQPGGWIELDFPQEPEKPAAPPVGLAESLGVQPQYVGRNRFDYLVEVDSEQTLRGLAPDFARLRDMTTRGLIVTSRSENPSFDFVSRFFAPAVGVNEDPVTGSAHCCLGPYWQTRLNKKEMSAFQASARGGVLKVRVEDRRVFISGQAVTVLKGDLVR